MHVIEPNYISPLLILLLFCVGVLVTVLAGTMLSRYADELALRRNLDKGFIGMLFLAGITSLPELAVCFSALLREPLTRGCDLALGNILGSNLFNLFILGLTGLFFARTYHHMQVRRAQKKSLLQGLILIGWLALILHNQDTLSIQIPFLDCALVLLPIPLFYLWSLRSTQQQTEPLAASSEIEPARDQRSFLFFYSRLILLSLCVVASGILLSYVGGRMTLSTELGGFNLSATFVGTLFLAFSTSLPECVIAVAALRMGHADMAAGNIVGSNIFNLLILCISDSVLRNESLLAHCSPEHILSLIGIGLLSLAAYLFFRSRTQREHTYSAILIVLLYLFLLNLGI